MVSYNNYFAITSDLTRKRFRKVSFSFWLAYLFELYPLACLILMGYLHGCIVILNGFVCNGYRQTINLFSVGNSV